MLSLNRKIYRAVHRTRDGNFTLNGLLGFDMSGKTAGVIGMGRIAKELIRILHGFGMNIMAYDLYPDKEFAERYGVKIVQLDELYAHSDIISLHCPLTPDTKFLINRESISRTSSRDSAPSRWGRPVSTYMRKRKNTSTRTRAER